MSTVPQPFTVDDLYELGWVEEPAIHPAGGVIAYVRVSIDRAGNCYKRAIWLAEPGGHPRRQLTAGQRSDTSPRWSPEGNQIVFLSNREGERAQIYLIDLRGGEARQLTNLPNGASDPTWSPDGKQIAFLARTTPEEREQEDAAPVLQPSDAFEHRYAKERRANAEERQNDPRVVRTLPYRTGTTYRDGRKPHIYILDLPADAESELSTPRRLSEGDLAFGAPAWAHDGRSILAACERDPQADSLFGYNDLVRVPILEAGRGVLERLTEPGFSYAAPRPSPDGQWIAATRRDDTRPIVHGSVLVVLPATGGVPRTLTEQSDLNVQEYRWAPDSTALLFLAAWWGEQPIYRVAIDGQSAVEPAFQPAVERVVAEFDVARDGSIGFIAGTDANPCELYTVEANGTEWQLTAIHTAIFAKRHVVPFEELRYTAPDGQQVQGWVLYPPNFDAAKHYPLAVHIHGGPHLMWSPGYRAMWHELQTCAGAGYVTFFCNPRGSDGYGEQWRDGVHATWSAAAQDILAGVDLLVARGQIDTKRMVVTGGSYGGYMTAWLIAHDQRFACAVAARGVYDLISFHGTSDAHELIEFEFDGFPWQQLDVVWAESPLAHAHRITIPLLLLHAELDWRVPISQAEQLFSNLRRRRIPVELVRYPREGHELTRSGEPDHRADHMRRTLEWFARYAAALG